MHAVLKVAPICLMLGACASAQTLEAEDRVESSKPARVIAACAMQKAEAASANIQYEEISGLRQFRISDNVQMSLVMGLGNAGNWKPWMVTITEAGSGSVIEAKGATGPLRRQGLGYVTPCL